MDTYRCISAAQAAELIDAGATIADIRDAGSFQQSHIPGAHNVSNENLPQFIAEADLDAPLIVCCYHGISSQSAAAYLLNQGFDTVYSLDGGYELWHMTYPDRHQAG